MALGSVTEHEECFFSKHHSLNRREAWDHLTPRPRTDDPENLIQPDLIQLPDQIRRETSLVMLENPLNFTLVWEQKGACLLLSEFGPGFNFILQH